MASYGEDVPNIQSNNSFDCVLLHIFGFSETNTELLLFIEYFLLNKVLKSNLTLIYNF